MLRLMADHDVEGHLDVLLRIWTSIRWRALWQALDCRIESFERLGIRVDASDAEVWQMCQDNEILLVTGNRNEESQLSLEATIRNLGSARSLPVLTISRPGRVMKDSNYAEQVAERVLEFLIDLENLRGAGRLYVP